MVCMLSGVQVLMFDIAPRQRLIFAASGDDGKAVEVGATTCVVALDTGPLVDCTPTAVRLA